MPLRVGIYAPDNGTAVHALRELIPALDESAFVLVDARAERHPSPPLSDEETGERMTTWSPRP